MARPRSDVGRVQFRDIQLELVNEEPISVFIHFREAKESQVKSTVLGLIGDSNMYLVSTLFHFLKKSNHLRSNLPVDHLLFLAYINEPDKLKSVSPSTVATWVSEAMKKAGIDTKVYKPHSIRSASSIKAVENGISIYQVKQRANWNHRSNTFEKHYFKPTAQQNNSTNIANSIFSSQGEHTTLESESQSTRIVERTTNNTSVDGDEDENVVTTHPTWFSWLRNQFHN